MNVLIPNREVLNTDKTLVLLYSCVGKDIQ